MRYIKNLWPTKHTKCTKKFFGYQIIKSLLIMWIFVSFYLMVWPAGLMAEADTNCTLAMNCFEQETEQFLKAKELVFKGEWNQARIQFEKYLVNYVDGSYRDEAYYWLARSLNKLSKEEVIVEKVIALKEEAAAKLDILIDNYPESLWLDDGVTLRLSLAAELDFMGKGGLYKQVQKLLLKRGLDIPSTKASDITYFLEMRPEVAVSLVRRMFEFQTDPKGRKELVALFGQHFGDDGQEFLREVANSDDSPEVKKEANYWLDRTKMREIPSQLIYFGYSTEISDKTEISRIPEKKINFYPIPRVDLENREGVKSSLNRFFHQKLKNVKFVTASSVDLYLYGMEFSNNIQGFNFKILQEDLQKDWDNISGTLRFRDNGSNKEFKKRFVVNEKNDQLVAMRKKNKLVLIVLHFVPSPAEQEQPPKLPVKILFHSVFSNVLGCNVMSSRGNFSMKELNKEGAVSEFGQAKAEIPTKSGTWILQGDLIVDRHSRKFIARGAELRDASGKVMAKGSQIIVPVDHPERYEVVGKK